MNTYYDDLGIPDGTSLERDGERWRIVAPASNARGARILIPFLLLFSCGLGAAVCTECQEPEPDWTFLVTFLLCTVPLMLYFWAWGLITLFGRVVIRGDKDHGRVFVGVAFVGWYKSFEVQAIRGICVDSSEEMPAHEYGVRIVLKGPSPIRFGASLGQQARDFVVKALTQVLPCNPAESDEPEPEPGVTAPCARCGRVNSVDGRVCPRCEEKLHG